MFRAFRASRCFRAEDVGSDVRTDYLLQELRLDVRVAAVDVRMFAFLGLAHRVVALGSPLNSQHLCDVWLPKRGNSRELLCGEPTIPLSHEP